MAPDSLQVSLSDVLSLGCRPASSKYKVQTWALLYWEFHYAKRIAETFFVHRYALCPAETWLLPASDPELQQQAMFTLQV